jgi:HEAT repeat protein
MFYTRHSFLSALSIILTIAIGCGDSRTDKAAEKLSYPDVLVRIEAVRQLGEIGGRAAIKLLSTSLESDTSTEVRLNVARTFGTLKNARAVPALIQCLADTLSPTPIRAECAKALGKIGDKRAVQPLIVAMNDEQYEPCGDLRCKKWDLHRAAIEALGSIGDKSATLPLVELLERSTDEFRRAMACWALGALRDTAGVDPLLRALEDKFPVVRAWSAAALGLAAAFGVINDQRAVLPLLTMLSDSSAQVRIKSVEALGMMRRYLDSLQPIVNICLHDDSASVRKAALDELAGTADLQTAIEALITALQSPDTVVQQRILEVSERLAYLGRCRGQLTSAISTVFNHLSPALQERALSGVILLCPDSSSSTVGLLISLIHERFDTTVLADWGWRYHRQRSRALRLFGDAFQETAFGKVKVPIDDPIFGRRYFVVEGVWWRLAIRALATVRRDNAIRALSSCLASWPRGPEVAESLDSLRWEPTSLEDSIHYWIGRGSATDLYANRGDALCVLSSELRSKDLPAFENAAYASITMGFKELLPLLIKGLNSLDFGSTKRYNYWWDVSPKLTESRKQVIIVQIVETYLNCGEVQLRQAAENWATEHSYEVKPRKIQDLEVSLTWGGGF